MKPLINEIVQMLQNRPEIAMSENWPDEKGIYSIAGIKKYMKSKGYTTDMTDQALHQIQNTKGSELDYVLIRNNTYKEPYPYFYKGLSEGELNLLTKEYNGYKNS